MDAEVFSIAGLSITWGHLVAAAGLLVAVFLLSRLFSSRRKAKTAVDEMLSPHRSGADDAFLKGISHLMADHTDQAIEEFTRAVTLNSDTVETYVVLGNLFRQKGEIERAVRIRQNIIARPNLDKGVRLQALFDLGLDYKKGGLFNRAAEAFSEVLSTDPNHLEACRQVVSLYEEMREWEKAFDSLKRMDRLTGENNRSVLAHYKTERGKELMAEGHLDRAEDFFSQAISAHKACLDAYLHLGDLELARGRHKKAISVWRKAVRLAPLHAHLVLKRVSEAEADLGQGAVDVFFNEIDADQAEVATIIAMAHYYRRHQEDQKALEILSLAVRKSPSNLEAHRLRGEILLALGDGEQALSAYAQLLDQINGDRSAYQCSNCGLLTSQLTWKCPRCLKWDTIHPPEQLPQPPIPV